MNNKINLYLFSFVYIFCISYVVQVLSIHHFSYQVVFIHVDTSQIKMDTPGVLERFKFIKKHGLKSTERDRKTERGTYHYHFYHG